MSTYEEGIQLIDELFGNYRDNIVSVATIAIDSRSDGMPKPIVREVDAYYEEGVFYSITHAKSGKMKQIAVNPHVAFSVCGKWFNGVGIAENLGWTLDPANAEIRTKLRKAFEKWYDMANDESDKDCCFLAIRLIEGTINMNHGEKIIHLNFEKHEIKNN